MEFAKQQFHLHVPGKDGSTPLQHFEQAARSLRKPLAAVMGYELIQCPPGVVYLWQLFHELNDARSGTGFSLLPLSYTEIWAWCQLTGVRLEAWEVLALRQVDKTYLAAHYERSKHA